MMKSAAANEYKVLQLHDDESYNYMMTRATRMKKTTKATNSGLQHNR
jgi:hypothetical protein